MAAAFWESACGAQRGTAPLEDTNPYESLGTLGGGPLLELQRTGSGTPARVHLDIETDDVAAEIRRVEGLGATVLERHDSYAVLTDPGGLVFCVVPVQREGDFEAHAVSWP